MAIGMVSWMLEFQALVGRKNYLYGNQWYVFFNMSPITQAKASGQAMLQFYLSLDLRHHWCPRPRLQFLHYLSEVKQLCLLVELS